jgi:hypothetical protein
LKDTRSGSIGIVHAGALTLLKIAGSTRAQP